MLGRLWELADEARSMAATTARFGRGMAARPASRQPEKLLELYEFEACPYCRVVREALTELDLDVLVRPCPKDGTRYRSQVLEIGGKAQFPFLVDPNTEEKLYESGEIVRYLYRQYGDREVPWNRQFAWIDNGLSSMAGVARVGAGYRARASKEPKQPLELYSFELSPYARRVRETLCELEIPYVLRNAGRRRLADYVPAQLRGTAIDRMGSDEGNRAALRQRAGKVTIPYLVDPNTDKELFESRRIRSYLVETYAA